jgi:oligopeptide/dipeptide ABC transporter ATP-binding protein
VAEGGGNEILLEARDLATWFPIKKGILRTVRGYVKAVDGVSLAMPRGRTLGLVGESGCGKTTFGRTILRLARARGGQVLYTQDHRQVDLLTMDPKDLLAIRRRLQIIFQDPFSSLNPRMSVGDVVGEYMEIHRIAGRRERIVELLEAVGLGSDYLYRYPHEFSGGQRQRIGIARALSLQPEFIVCDEPVSALDVSIQAQIINLLRNLQRDRHLTYLFISHDLRVVRFLSDRVAVMYLGRIVEEGDAEALYRSPRHPYTEALLSAIPRYAAAGGEPGRRIVLEGDVPSPANPPPGCRFHPRCRYAIDRCRNEEPPLRDAEGAPDHRVACHREATLTLNGVEQEDERS